MRNYNIFYCEIELPVRNRKKKVFHGSFQAKPFDEKVGIYKIDKDGAMWKYNSYSQLTGDFKWSRNYISRKMFLWGLVKIEEGDYLGIWKMEVKDGLVNLDSLRLVQLESFGE